METCFRTSLGCLLAMLLVSGSALADPWTLEEVVARALAHAPSLKAREAGLNKARYERHAALAEIGPRLNLSADYQRWDSALTFTFQGPDPATIPPEFSWVTDLFGSGDSTIRAQNTWSASVAVVQPITGLAPLALAAHLARLNVDRVALDVAAERRRVRMAAIEGFLNLWKSRRGVAVLEDLLKAAREHQRQALDAERVGLLKRDDVLRIDVQIANLEQSLDMARMGVEVQQSSLALMMGLPMDATVDLSEPRPDDRDLPALGPCIARALEAREEVRQVRLALDMARTARDLQGTAWIPQVSGLFSYNRATATQFSKPDSWFVGLTAQWNVWDWGRNFLKFRAAEADVESARRAADQIQDLVRLDVKARWLALQNARAQAVRAERAVIQARENLRIQMERSRTGLNTTSDVLDAEALVLQSETSALDARQEAWLAWEQLQEAMGGRWP